MLARRHSKQTCVAVCRRARLAVTTLPHTAGTTTAGLCLRHTRWKRAAALASQERGRLLAPRAHLRPTLARSADCRRKVRQHDTSITSNACHANDFGHDLIDPAAIDVWPVSVVRR